MKSRSPVVGVLALQGDYQRHQEVLGKIDISAPAVRNADDFSKIDRLLIPGGESSVIVLLLKKLSMEETFISFIKTRPVWGTCAGMILLSKNVNDGSIKPYGVIDIAVDRNGYGRQVYSTVLSSEINIDGNRDNLDLVFVRAPRVTETGKGVTPLIFRQDEPVMLKQGNVLVSAFHPELTGSTVLHEYFARKFFYE